MVGMTQADVGQAALKMGESVFSGMKFFGGMALDYPRVQREVMEDRILHLKRGPNANEFNAALEEAGLTSGNGAGGFGFGDLDRMSATQVYKLHCGYTTAVMEGFDWARDGRWTALGTRNRKVHVFAVNPYGGSPDVKSHLEARVRNVELVVRCVFHGCFDYVISYLLIKSHV